MFSGSLNVSPLCISFFLCIYIYILCVILLTCSIVVQHVGDLGNIVAGPDGRASFRLEDSQIKVTNTHFALSLMELSVI